MNLILEIWLLHSGGSIDVAMSSSEWSVVGKKGRRRVEKHQHGHEHSNETLEPHDTTACVTLEEAKASLLRLSIDVAASAFFKSIERAFTAVEEACSVPSNDDSLPAQTTYWSQFSCVRCYGLGSPTSSLNARAQLALVVPLLKLLTNSTSICFYDPIFSALDKDLIAACGYSVLSAEEAQAHTAQGPTFFYMPHCDASIYNDVLDINWSIDQLVNIAILGNSFEGMQDRWSGPTFKRRAGRPHRVLALTDHDLVREEKLQGSGFRVDTAFNDTSLQVFVRAVLEKAPLVFQS